MLTKFTENIAIFFFAHQDDEFGIFQKIIDERQIGRRVVCAYLTNGNSEDCKKIIRKRNQESINVLTRLGISKEDIHFAGSELSISDARLPYCLEAASHWIRNCFNTFPNIKAVYIPAWEGGHHDHDALHALIVNFADEKNILPLVKQFPLYNSYRLAGPFFNVLTPLLTNGSIETTTIPWKNRILFLRFCLSYPSQIKTWIGLFPFVLLHYIFSGKQVLQQVSLKITFQKPHNGNLYYEKRKSFSWKKMDGCLNSWREKL
jgi:LmbE family N-acetylglucosaminyl deacetylase